MAYEVESRRGGAARWKAGAVVGSTVVPAHVVGVKDSRHWWQPADASVRAMMIVALPEPCQVGDALGVSVAGLREGRAVEQRVHEGLVPATGLRPVEPGVHLAVTCSSSRQARRTRLVPQRELSLNTHHIAMPCTAKSHRSLAVKAAVKAALSSGRISALVGGVAGQVRDLMADSGMPRDLLRAREAFATALADRSRALASRCARSRVRRARRAAGARGSRFGATSRERPSRTRTLQTVEWAIPISEP